VQQSFSFHNFNDAAIIEILKPLDFDVGHEEFIELYKTANTKFEEKFGEVAASTDVDWKVYETVAYENEVIESSGSSILPRHLFVGSTHFILNNGSQNGEAKQSEKHSSFDVIEEMRAMKAEIENVKSSNIEKVNILTASNVELTKRVDDLTISNVQLTLSNVQLTKRVEDLTISNVQLQESVLCLQEYVCPMQEVDRRSLIYKLREFICEQLGREPDTDRVNS